MSRRMTPLNIERSWTLAAALLSVSGCSRSPLQAQGPIDVAGTPVVVQFDRPFASTGGDCDLRLEFDRPGDSRHARSIHAVLVTSEGRRDTLTGVRLDRRGENVVSLIGRPGPAAAGDQEQRSYRALELRSEVPLRLSGIRGSSGL